MSKSATACPSAVGFALPTLHRTATETCWSGYRAKNVRYPAVAPPWLTSLTPSYASTVSPSAYEMRRPPRSTMRVCIVSTNARPPTVGLKKFSFHRSRSSTVVSRPPFPIMFVNDMSVLKPRWAVPAYAVVRPFTTAVKSSRQRVCVMPSGLKSRACVKASRLWPLTRCTMSPSSE